MKTLLLIIAIPFLILAVLRSELTPWRLVSPTERAAQLAQVQALEQQLRQAKQAQAAQEQRPRLSDGSWMMDAFHGSLDKAPGTGRSDGGKPRSR